MTRYLCLHTPGGQRLVRIFRHIQGKSVMRLQDVNLHI
jgi:hypothetical protein